jgi:hypothetical protein
MHIWHTRDRLGRIAGRGAAGAAAAIVLACVGGCAAPGPPLPPTLNLPKIVSHDGLTALRVGDTVSLHWTTPSKTTDKLMVKGPMMAEVCRELLASSAPVKIGSTPGCAAVLRIAVAAGASETTDPLPAALAAGPVRLLAYRVRLLNAAGRTAGLSPAVYAAAGSAPDEVAGFVGEVNSAGVELRWQRETGSGSGRVELDRTLLDPAPPVKGEQKSGLPGTGRQPLEIRLRAEETQSSGAGAGGAGGMISGGTDAGGMVDRTVEIGHSYRYTAQRVVATMVAGQAVELRGETSPSLTFTVRDVFPPRVPGGLVAVPAFAGDSAQRPAIDLSWDAVLDQNVKPRLAGYNVYRRKQDGAGSESWSLLTQGLVTAAAYRDADVKAGQRYVYRVTAVSTTGHESAASGEAVETAPQVQ